jgi:hypothetical protein
MRLSEFANPKDYAPTDTDAPIWSNCSADDLVPSLPAERIQQPGKRTKLADALSIGCHVGGDQLRSCRGASQRPTA